jgi:8-oxo-dGTP pyrophosphatase MutT (NUDIX family)
MYRKKLICMNCGKEGHIFKKCSLPIRSYGIIGIKDNEILLIQRKDTIGFSDFMRGKYKTKNIIHKWKLKCLLEEMTEEEFNRIKTKTFEELWFQLWLDRDNAIFRNEKLKAQNLFESEYVKDIVNNSRIPKYTQTEWGFPKGRKNLNENDMDCAKREFMEETGLKHSDFKIIDENKVIVENFIASDGVNYTHIYYIAIIKETVDLKSIVKTHIFNQEVRDIGFFDYKTCYRMLRDYDVEKKKILTIINENYLKTNFFLGI